MKKSFQNKVIEHVLNHCYTPPQGFEFSVRNLFLQLRQDEAGRYVPGQVSYEVYCENEPKTTGHINIMSLISCPGCGGEAGDYIENRCCACDSERRFNLSDIEWVQELCIQHMDRDPTTNIPVSMIDRVKWTDGGWDIHCDNGHNYCIKAGLLYDIGSDACPMPRAQRSVGMTI